MGRCADGAPRQTTKGTTSLWSCDDDQSQAWRGEAYFAAQARRCCCTRTFLANSRAFNHSLTMRAQLLSRTNAAEACCNEISKLRTVANRCTKAYHLTFLARTTAPTPAATVASSLSETGRKRRRSAVQATDKSDGEWCMDGNLLSESFGLLCHDRNDTPSQGGNTARRAHMREPRLDKVQHGGGRTITVQRTHTSHRPAAPSKNRPSPTEQVVTQAK
jgi:hypothetical protein